MRIVKEHDVRKKELLDTAERLFMERGYQQTKIDHIRDAVGIAKGTFYHYFKSKEEILDAIIERILEDDLEKAEKIARKKSLPPPEKLFQILVSQRPKAGGSKEHITKTLHEPENAEMHMKTLTGSIKRICPVMAEVVAEGVKKGCFQTSYPREVIEILAVSGQVLFDPGMFTWQEEERSRLLIAFVDSMEKLLGAEKGCFDFIYEVLGHE